MADDNAACGATVAEVLACSFHRWYHSFRDVTFPSAVITLPEGFVQYLLSDGVHLPPQLDDAGSDSSGWGDGGSDSGDEAGALDEAAVREVVDAATRAIEDLGGAVLPKLNWSAPKDAKWVFGTLKCQTVRDVFTLLKSSDFVAHDLCHSFDDCVDRDGQEPPRPDCYCLVLREWRSMNVANEFRCFVRDRQLLAVSQRHTSTFYPHLVDPEFQAAVLESIADFFSARVRDSFASERYAFDLLLGKPPRLKVRLVDFSPWAPSTDPLLFDWEELAALPAPTGMPEFRAVAREGEGRAKLEHYHSLPLEVAELGVHSPEEMEALCTRAEEATRGPERQAA
eukprot:CAMPEP_0204611758 /NCGR_PEP_ID=MMETSP0661-20131031/62182_1 /ASSEMBLY_ACC=CAM_ASM_000606 /TAXON_ID=109239 /ORGANISM="Alexandrium margalefi, Strain AMGDE01CS-322" /LENGTH=338 /DNA_ID=CAMNT_0051623603 /DNA_START=62 /DNA_END=1078 /DNA_ORIENTATION=-